MQRSARIELVARRALDDRKGALAACRWYSEARAFCAVLANRFGLPLESVAGYIAATSPQTEWVSQLKFAPLALAHYTESAWNIDGSPVSTERGIGRKLPGPGFDSSKRKAVRILNGADPLSVLGGDKVRAFYLSILGDESAVCVDRHALAIAYGADVPEHITAKRYRETAAAYVSASASLCAAFPSLSSVLTPAAVQALTWVWWRDNTAAQF
jgi:hypothetical protein